MCLHAWASGTSAWDGRTERERREGHRAKERGRALKKRGLGGETREEGKESPQVFDLGQLNSKCANFLLLGKLVLSKENAYFCKRINTTLPFPAAIRRPYSAKSRFVPDESTQTIFDFRLFATTQHTVPRQLPPIEVLFRGRCFARCLSPLGKCIVVHRDRNNLCMRTFSDIKFCPSANI